MTDIDAPTYQFTIVRAVPHVHRGEYFNVGVILHCRTREYLAMRAITSPVARGPLTEHVDWEMLLRYLDSYKRICAGDATAGPIALLPSSERFHWLTAPRSDLLQTSPVHEGVGVGGESEIDSLFEEFVGDGV